MHNPVYHRDVRIIAPATEADMMQAFGDAEPNWLTRRGYPDKFIFERFPADCVWEWVELADAELLGLRHIMNEAGWLEFSGPDRRPAFAANWVREHPDEPVAVDIREYSERFDAGDTPPPIVLVSTSARDELVVMEGNRRIAAAALAGVPASRLRFLLGTSATMADWAFFTDSTFE